MKTFVLFVLSIFSTVTAYSQLPIDYPFKTHLDTDNNLLITGYRHEDFLSEKYTFQGATIWSRDFVNPSFDRGYGIVSDAAGNAYSAGFIFNSATKSNDLFIVKYEAALGHIQMAKAFESPFDDKAISIAIDYERNLYIAGYITNALGFKDIITQKYDEDGNLLWSYTYDNPTYKKDDVATHILVDTGFVYVAGYTYNGEYNKNDVVLLQYPRDGFDDHKVTLVPISKTNETPTGFVFSEISLNRIQKSRSAVVVVTDNPGTIPSSKFLTLYFDGGIQSEVRWMKKFSLDNTKHNIPTSIASDRNGDIYVTGYVHRGESFGYDYATIKYKKQDGSYGWTPGVAYFDFPQSPGGDDKSSSLKVSSDGFVYAAGSSRNSPNGYSIVRYSQSGDIVTQDWTQVFNPSFTEGTKEQAFLKSAELNLDNAGNPVMTASIWDEASADYAIIKYDQNGNVMFTIDDGNDMPGGVSFDNASAKDRSQTSSKLYQNSPNPFNPATSISYKLKVAGYTDIKVFDLTGKEVASLVNKSQSPGEYSVTFDGSALSSGMYFYSLLVNGSVVETKRLMLVK
jgi:hypothetical protein